MALVAPAAMALLLRRPQAAPHAFGPTPQQPLAGRFARGGIDDEYYRRFSALEYNGPPEKTR